MIPAHKYIYAHDEYVCFCMHHNEFKNLNFITNSIYIPSIKMQYLFMELTQLLVTSTAVKHSIDVNIVDLQENKTTDNFHC